MIGSLENLDNLWIAGTGVDDSLVDYLLGLPGLSQLDVRKTRMSEAGRKRLNVRFKLVD